MAPTSNLVMKLIFPLLTIFIEQYETSDYSSIDHNQLNIKLKHELCSGHVGLDRLFKRRFDCSMKVSTPLEIEISNICFRETYRWQRPLTWSEEKSIICTDENIGLNLTKCELELGKRTIDFESKQDRLIECTDSDLRPFLDYKLNMIAYCVDFDKNLTKSIESTLKCEFESQSRSLELQQLKSDCWKQNGVEWPTNFEARHDVICSDFDRVIEVKVCELVGQSMDENLMKLSADAIDLQQKCLIAQHISE